MNLLGTATARIIPWVKNAINLCTRGSHIVDIQEVGFGSVMAINSASSDIGYVSARSIMSQFYFGSLPSVEGEIVKVSDPFV